METLSWAVIQIEERSYGKCHIPITQWYEKREDAALAFESFKNKAKNIYIARYEPE